MSTITLAPPPPHGAPSASTGPHPVRPKFNSHITSDRLREGAGLVLPPFAARASNLRKGRTSVFREMGLEDDVALFGANSYLAVANDVNRDDGVAPTADATTQQAANSNSKPWYAKLASRPGLEKRHSSQGRGIPTVNVVGADGQ
ncbi:hypothetical protein K4F52_002401 [Lecanicillium sp. MT-2017a]|nr:hypothetical protein K4F52_002401 [Lecanicillium sp. MT-2017a]